MIISIRSLILNETSDTLQTTIQQLEESDRECMHSSGEAGQAQCQTFLLGLLHQSLRKANIEVNKIIEWTDSISQLHHRFRSIGMVSQGSRPGCISNLLATMHDSVRSVLDRARVDPVSEYGAHLNRQSLMTDAFEASTEFGSDWPALED